MKNYFATLLLLLSAAGSLTSCRESSKIPEPAYENIPIIFPEINPQKSFFDANKSRLSVIQATAGNITRPVFEFVVNPSQGYTEIQTVEVYRSFYSNALKALGPRVKDRDLTSFPATVTIDSQAALEGLYLVSLIPGNPPPTPIKGASPGLVNRVLPNDAVVFTFEYIMKDGRRIILTPLATAPGAVGVPTGSLVNAPLAAVATFKQ